MKKNLNKPSTYPGGQNTVKNFSELNYKDVNLGGRKIARTFFRINLNEKYGQIASKEHPDYFYIKTESGNVYRVGKTSRDTLWKMTKGNQEKCQEIIDSGKERCIYNPKTKNVHAVDNNEIKLGDIFSYAPTCATSQVREIVGVASSQRIIPAENITLKSDIEQEFMKKMK